jgi:hypothetical protein
LVLSGGTDFHGDNTPGVEMGCADGGFKVPFSVYTDLIEALP